MGGKKKKSKKCVTSSLASSECSWGSDCDGAYDEGMFEEDSEDESNAMPYMMCSVEPEMLRCRRSLRSSSGGPRRGSANAARVSRGTEHDVWPGLSVKEPKRH